MRRFSLTTAIMIASSLILGDQLTRLVVAVAIAFAVLPIWKAVSEHHYQRGVDAGIDQGYTAAWEDVRGIIGGASDSQPGATPLSAPAANPQARPVDRL